MDRSWMSSAALQFALLSTSTVTAPGGGNLRCAPQTLRLLHVTRGECYVQWSGRREHLIGERMLLIFGEQGYRIEQVSEDLLLSQVDFSHAPCTPPAFALRDLYQCYQDYRQLCHGPEEPLCFHDRFSQVRFTVKNLSQYAGFEQPLRGHILSMTLNYLMIVIACASQETSRQPYQYNRHVRRAIQYMHENYMCNITAEDIASYIGVHPGHLHRLFRTDIGTRVTEYLIRLRIEKSKSLLKRTDLPIAQIAEMVGISTQQYLSRLFKRQVGITPQEYRKSYNVTCDYDQVQQCYSTTVYQLKARERERL